MKEEGFLKKFTAVDLVTIAVFAVLFRTLWFTFRMIGFFFPWNQLYLQFCSVFSIVACVVIVNKFGTALLYSIVWNIGINFFFQGEDPFYLGFTPISILVDFAWLALRDFGQTRKSALVGGVIYGLCWGTVVAGITWTYFYLVYVPLEIYIIYTILGGAVIYPVASMLGHSFGHRIKGLIG